MATYPAQVLADGAIAYWRLDETSGNVISQVGGYSGTVSGGITRGVAGPLADGNPAMGFPGAVSGFIEVPATPALALTTAVTIEAWVNVPVANAAGVVFEKTIGGSWTTSYGLYIDGGGWTCRVVSGSFVDALAPPLVEYANRWVYFVGTVSPTAVKVYIDGVEKATAARSGAIAAGSGVARIGKGGSDVYPMNGLIDEVAIYPTALTPAQITAHYNLRSATSMPAWHDLRYRYCRFVRAPGWRRSA